MKLFLMFGALLMAVAVMLGAFGAHGLKGKLTPEMMQVYRTGVEYHFYHALGVLLIGAIAGFYPQAQGVQWAGWALIVGIFLFSGSLYALALSGIRWFGPITPLGGVFFIIGWVMLAVSIYRH